MDCVWLITEGRLCAQKRDGWSCWSRSLIPHVQECVGFDRKNFCFHQFEAILVLEVRFSVKV